MARPNGDGPQKIEMRREIMSALTNEHRGKTDMDWLLAALDDVLDSITVTLKITGSTEVIYRAALRLLMTTCYEVEEEASLIIYGGGCCPCSQCCTQTTRL